MLSVVPQALLLGVRLHQGELLFFAPGEPQVVDCLLVIGKIAAVEPNSGLMLPSVARFASGTSATPSP